MSRFIRLFPLYYHSGVSYRAVFLDLNIAIYVLFFLYFKLPSNVRVKKRIEYVKHNQMKYKNPYQRRFSKDEVTKKKNLLDAWYVRNRRKKKKHISIHCKILLWLLVPFKRFPNNNRMRQSKQFHVASWINANIPIDPFSFANAFFGTGFTCEHKKNRSEMN